MVSRETRKAQSLPRCPRCRAPFDAAAGDRCSLCGLTWGSPFDPTAGLREGKKYLGKIIGGHFQTLSILACGGHGLVLLVRHTKLENRNIFALKLLKPELSRNQEFRRRFLREAEIVYGFSHPNIVPIREFDETKDGVLFFTMDFCRGVTLDEAMRSGAPLPFDRILRIVDDILQGLDFAHRHGVIHRDLKPANVFLEESADGELARILDFGIAKPVEGESMELTAGQKIVGTPVYMSPEQILGKPLDARSDLYSLGIVIYRMVVGKPPFTGNTGHEILARHLRDQPTPLRNLKKDVPHGFSDVIDRLLAKPRDRRPESAAALREELAEFTTGGTGGTGRRHDRGRRPLVWTIAAACVLGVALTLSWWFLFTSAGRARAEAIHNSVVGPVEPKAQQPGAPPVPARSGAGGQQNRNDPHAGNSDSPNPPSHATKWCRFCRKWWPEKAVTCPDCGQILTRPSK